MGQTVQIKKKVPKRRERSRLLRGKKLHPGKKKHTGKGENRSEFSAEGGGPRAGGRLEGKKRKASQGGRSRQNRSGEKNPPQNWKVARKNLVAF